MTRGRVIGLALGGVSLGVLVLAAFWAIFVGVPRWLGGTPEDPSPAAVTAGPDSLAPKIKARLFYVADDGLRLMSIEQDVPYARQTSDQAREILNAQLAPVPEPLLSAIPAGTVLRAVYVTPQGDAFVDLSQDAATSHPGGSLNELLTIYTVVHALTFNLPAITAVQLLVDGKEVDTLGGHIDLRRPLAKNLQLISEPVP